MATIDEYIADNLTNIQTYVDVRSGLPNLNDNIIPPAEFVTDPNIVSIVQQSTARGALEVIPLVETQRGQLLENTNLRDDDAALTQALTSKIETSESVLAVGVSQTEVDSREEAFVPSSTETPQKVSVIVFGEPPATLPITEIIPDKSTEQQTEEQAFNAAVGSQNDEQSSTVDLQLAITEDVSQSVPPEAQIIVQQFFADVAAIAEEQSTSDLTAIAASTERTIEKFVFDPGKSLFAAADAQYETAQAAVEEVAAATEQVSAALADTSSFDSFTSTESLASSG